MDNEYVVAILIFLAFNLISSKIDLLSCGSMQFVLMLVQMNDSSTGTSMPDVVAPHLIEDSYLLSLVRPVIRVGLFVL